MRHARFITSTTRADTSLHAQEFRAQGPQGVYRAVASAPWVRASSDALRGTGVPSWVTGTMGGSNGR